MERMQLAAEREFYLAEHLQYLIPYEWLELYGPSQPNQDVFDPAQQNDKNDFHRNRTCATFALRMPMS